MRARLKPLSARSEATGSAYCPGTLKLMPTALRSIDAGGVSRYARHGCSQCERAPQGSRLCWVESIGFWSVCQAASPVFVWLGDVVVEEVDDPPGESLLGFARVWR